MSQIDQVIIRRRRIAALAIVAILVILIWSVSQLFTGQSQAQVDLEATTVEEVITAEITDCAPGVVSLSAMIGSYDAATETSETLNSFESGATPYLWYEVTNTGLVDCRFNVGTRVTFFTITSGEQTYWSSGDCLREDVQDSTVLLEANVTRTAASGPWDRVYSSGEGCNADQGMPKVPAGGATYKLKVVVDNVISEDVRFILN
jgi:hypothetical protein